MAEIFDFSDEVSLLDQAFDRYGVEPQVFFCLCQAAGMIAAVVPAFEIERTASGCILTGFGRLCIHQIEVREAENDSFATLTAQVINDRAPCEPEVVFGGIASLPASWVGIVKHIYRNERSILWMADFGERLKSEWQKYLDVRRDRLGF
jgi:hypothetical protein